MTCTTLILVLLFLLLDFFYGKEKYICVLLKLCC